jgi:hypothetical protein
VKASKAIITAFYPYQNVQDEHYRVYEDAYFHFLHMWISAVDKVYLIDQDWGLKPPEWLEDKVIVIKTSDLEQPITHHWDSFAQVIPQIKEDYIIMLDSDMYVYDPDVISGLGGDVVAILDGSGGVKLDFPIMQPNEVRGERRRIAPYLCVVKKDFLSKTKLDFEPYRNSDDDWMDSFGKWTVDVFNHNPKFSELPDDRTTIMLDKDGNIEVSPWGDRNCGPTGYYHLRNFSLGLSLVNEFKYNKQAYEKRKSITPIGEATRQLGWLWALTAKFRPAFLSKIKDVVDDMNLKNWDKFIDKYYEVYKWV